MDAIKGALLSKTMWANWAVMALGAIDWLQAHSGMIAAVLPNTGPLLIIVGAVGTILRAVTTKPLAEK